MKLALMALLTTGCADAEALAPHETELAPAPLSVVTVSSPPGAWLGQQVLTGAGVYVPTPGTTTVHVRQQAAGGGGGGVGAGGFGVGAGGGGNSGLYLDYTVQLISGGAFSCGTGGTGGTAAPTAGGTGGDATLVLNGVTYIAKGGTGGTPGVKATSGVTGPALPAQGSTAVPVVTYGEGGLGFWSGTVAVASGRGGSSPFGAGGVAVGAGSGGIAGIRGGGGSGGASVSSVVGGPGGDGLIIVDEYAATSAAPTPSGTCSSASLSTPLPHFAGVIGQPIALLASATCAPGITPEFQYFGTDVNLNPVALTGFIAGSSSFIPSLAGDLCFSVVVRASGASDTVRSPWVCGTSTSSAALAASSAIDLAGAGWIVRQSSSGFPRLSSDGVWSFDPVTENEIVHEVSVPVGASIASIQVHMNRNNVNPLSGDVVVSLHRRTLTSQTSDIPMSAIVSSGSSWTTITLSPAAGAILPAVGQVMWLSIQTAGGFPSGQSPLFDNAAILLSI